MKKLFLLALALLTREAFAQQPKTDFTKDAKTELTALFEKFRQTEDSLKIEKTKLIGLAEKLDTASNAQLQKTRRLKLSLDSLYAESKVYKAFYTARKVNADSLNTYFAAQPSYATIESAEPDALPEKAVYILYGNNKIAEPEELFKDEKVKEIFGDILKIDSKTCLGNFEIPGYRQKIMLYKEKDKETAGPMFAPSNEFVYFTNVTFSVREGRIYDLRMRATSKDGIQQYYFENKIPISLLDYAKGSRLCYLFNMHNTTENVSDITNNNLNNHLVRLSDVLSYFSNPGNNFVPDDVEYSFPTDKEKNTKEIRRRVYSLNQDTNLQNVMELRTYTDFLGLFDDTANGIVQVEGKADFYIAPFQTSNHRPFTYFKKISPYVHFTRLDEEHKGLTLVDTSDTASIKKPLEIIEKSYLDMGLTLDLFGFSIKKQYPFSINPYYAMRYQIATIVQEPDGQTADTQEEDIQETAVGDGSTEATTAEGETEKILTNFKTIGNGIGIRFEFKRFNNFGFIYSPEIMFYNHLNRIDEIKNPDNFWVFRNEAELFYYPGESKKQSIFLRLRTYMNANDGEDSFFQLQFGYRFSIGLGNISRNN